MAHVHDPVIYHPRKAEVVNALQTVPIALAAALGWLVGSTWHLAVLIATGVGIVVGTTFLAVRHLVFAMYYGFLKGAQIQLVPKQPRNPSMPM